MAGWQGGQRAHGILSAAYCAMTQNSSNRFSSDPSAGLSEYERPAFPDAKTTARLLEEMTQGSLGPITKLQEALNLTVEQIADWMGHPRHRFVAANLVNLYDVQTQLMVCQHRLIAVARLAEVITSAESPETVRRACKDLLAVRLIDPYREDERPERPPPPAVVDEEKILEAFERLGAADGYRGYGDDDSPTPASAPPASAADCNAGPRGVRECVDASARANFGDGGANAGLPVVSDVRERPRESMRSAPERARTKPYEPPGCARSNSKGEESFDDPPTPPPRSGTIRCY